MEIKFRAWDKRKKRFITDPIEFELELISLDIKVSNLYIGFVNEYFEYFDIQQYTGLRDCNGKEIYQGDIVRFVGGTCNMLPCSPYQHEWHKKGTILVCRMLDSGWALSPKSILKYQEPNIVGNVQNYDFWNHQRSLEVIGNIYENPELTIKLLN